jgi:hypothetical protein
MNTSRDNLSEVLRDWRVTPPVNPDFRHSVWQRIGGPVRITWPGYLRAHTAAWSLAAVLAVTIASFTGSSLARAKAQADREAMAVTYLVELDPRVQAMFKP